MTGASGSTGCGGAAGDAGAASVSITGGISSGGTISTVGGAATGAGAGAGVGRAVLRAAAAMKVGFGARSGATMAAAGAGSTMATANLGSAGSGSRVSSTAHPTATIPPIPAAIANGIQSRRGGELRNRATTGAGGGAGAGSAGGGVTICGADPTGRVNTGVMLRTGGGRGSALGSGPTCIGTLGMRGQADARAKGLFGSSAMPTG